MGAWALVGLVAGILLMLGKALPIAESGVKPDNLSFYAIWIPVMGGGASAFGFILGLVFASCMALTERWRASVEARPSVVARYGPRMLCGAIAGGIIGLPLTHDANALIFVGLGLCSAAVSSVMNRRALNKKA